MSKVNGVSMLEASQPIWNSDQPVSILMPVCNEEDVIESVILEWVQTVIRYLPAGSELLIDDASTDGTRDILKKLVAAHPFIRVCYQPRKDGFANAARRLYREAKCPWVFFTDSDGQYIAKDFWKLAKNINDNYDLIRGAKVGRKDPILRRVASSVFNKIIQFLFNMSYLDFNSAFFLIKKPVLNTVLDHINCMETLINTELLLRVELENYNIKQVYVLHRTRQFGVSRGLPPLRFVSQSLKALHGLYRIKASYRVRET
jgi:glycosyltransferase involved in cell wall biosynthesis